MNHKQTFRQEFRGGYVLSPKTKAHGRRNPFYDFIGLRLTPSIDHLFDRGFISFDDDGETLISPVADRDALRRMGVNPDEPPRVGGFNSDQKFFLNHHRTSIFLADLAR